MNTIDKDKELLNATDKEVIIRLNPSNVDLHRAISQNSVQVLTKDFLIKDFSLFFCDIDASEKTIKLYVDSKEATNLINDITVKNITAFKIEDNKPIPCKIVSREELIAGLIFGYKKAFIRKHR